MKVKVIVQDEALRRLLLRVRDAAAVHRAAANTLLSITQATFNPSIGAAYRPKPWPPKADGSPCMLIRTGRLAHSFRVRASSSAGVVLTDAPYAPIHQFGGRTRPYIIRLARFIVSGRFLVSGRKRYAKYVRHPGARIPARPFFPIDDAGRLTPLAQDHVRHAVQDLLTPPGTR